MDERDLVEPPFVPGGRWWECSYERDGDRYGISIPAPTDEAAETALHEAFGNGQVDGELMGTIPAPPPGLD
jgi:hypothetical protein